MTPFEEALYNSDSIPNALLQYANLLRKEGGNENLLHAAKILEYKNIISIKSSSILRRIADDFYNQLSREMPNLRFRIAGRRKALISVEQKIQRNLKKGRSLDLIRDMLGIRIVLLNGSVDDCYTVTEKFISSCLEDGYTICEESEQNCDLQILESHSHTLSQFYYGITDYIAFPKENGYQSLHVVFRAPSGICFEFQIRTFDMHVDADVGLSDHAKYKEEKYGSFSFDRTKIKLPGYAVSQNGSIIDMIGLEHSLELLQRNKSY